MENIFDMEAPQDEEVKKEPEKEEERDLGKLMFDLPDAPNQEQVEAWKQEHGEVFCTGMSPTEMFVFRALTRVEFVKIQTIMQAQDNKLTQLDLEEQIVKRCILWSSKEGLASLDKKAGTLSTLHEQVLQNSNFVNPAMASALVIKL